jgi:hypothetical protein
MNRPEVLKKIIEIVDDHKVEVKDGEYLSMTRFLMDEYNRPLESKDSRAEIDELNRHERLYEEHRILLARYEMLGRFQPRDVRRIIFRRPERRSITQIREDTIIPDRYNYSSEASASAN